MFKVNKASRKAVRLRLGLFGASGSGKTMSALKMAKGLVGEWGKICVLDTENGSAALYDHLGEYMHCPFPPPFSPTRYSEAIDFICNNHKEIECIIIDSISQSWQWCVETVDSMPKSNGPSNWNHVKTKYKKMMNTITHCPVHVIVNCRTKSGIEIVEGDNGRKKAVKIAMKNVAEEGLDYELTSAFKIYENHYAEIDKDRTGIFDSTPFLITEETGETFKKWNGEMECRTITMIRNKLKLLCQQHRFKLKSIEEQFDFDSKRVVDMPKEKREELIEKLSKLGPKQ